MLRQLYLQTVHWNYWMTMRQDYQHIQHRIYMVIHSKIHLSIHHCCGGTPGSGYSQHAGTTNHTWQSWLYQPKDGNLGVVEGVSSFFQGRLMNFSPILHNLQNKKVTNVHPWVKGPEMPEIPWFQGQSREESLGSGAGSVLRLHATSQFVMPQGCLDMAGGCLY